MPAVSELAELVGGEVVGDGSRLILGVAPIESAGPEELAFLTDSRYRPFLQTTGAGAVVVGMGEVGDNRATLIRVADPHRAMAELLFSFPPEGDAPTPGVHPTAVVEGGVSLGEGVAIGPLVQIGAESRIGDRVIVGGGSYIGQGCEVGQESVLFPRVTVLDRVRIGARCRIQSGTVLGSEGYRYVTDGESAHRRVPHLGLVIVEDEVELGANVTVDRAVLGATRIGRGTKVDNLVHIAHNVEIGEDCLIVAQVGISGSVSMGRGVAVGGQAGIAGHLEIGEGAQIAARSGINHSVPPGAVVSGVPARSHRETRRIWAAMGELPKMLRDLRNLRKRVEGLEGRKKIGPDPDE